MSVPVADGTSRLADAVRAISDSGIELDDIGLRRPTLDEVFLALTGVAVVTLNFAPPAHPPGAWATANTYAGRTIKQFMRTPQLLVVNALTSIMFLLIFRFVFGGAIQTGDVEYVDFLIPALAAVNGLFAGGAVGVAEDTESGLFDRLRSLPVPRWALLLGRSIADTALIMWGTLVTSSSA